MTLDYNGGTIKVECVLTEIEFTGFVNEYIIHAKAKGTSTKFFCKPGYGGDLSKLGEKVEEAKKWIDNVMNPPVPEWKKILGELGFKEEVYR